MDDPVEPRLSPTKLFVIVSGAIAFFVDVYALLQIIGQIHLPSSITVPLPKLPEIQFVAANSLNIQSRDITLLLLIYVILAVMILVGRGDRDSTYSLVSEEQIAFGFAGVHFIFLLVFLWLFAFTEVPPPVFNFLTEVWLLSSVLLLFALVIWLQWIPEGYEGRFIGLLILSIPLWIFLQKSINQESWLAATLFVLSVLVATALYLAGIYLIYLGMVVVMTVLLPFFR